MLAITLAVSALLQEPSQSAAQIHIQVDPAVELTLIVVRLAGFPEFEQAAQQSAYLRAVDEHFEAYAKHPAVLQALELRRDHGISYDAVPSLGVHCEWRDGTLIEALPFDESPERLITRWAPERARAFVVQLNDFAVQSSYGGFRERWLPFYSEVEARLGAMLVGHDFAPWFQQYYGVQADAIYRLHPTPLAGKGSFGVGVRFPGLPEQLRPVLGCWLWDAEGLPRFDTSYLPLIVHEFAHSYANPQADRLLPKLETAGKQMWPKIAPQMEPQAYGKWSIVLAESLVRASVVNYMTQEQGAKAGQAQAAAEHRAGFTWVPGLAELLAKRGVGANGKTLSNASPAIETFFKDLAIMSEKRERQRPRLVAMSPSNGSQAVDPALTELRFEFNSPMASTYSVMGGGDNFPQVMGSPGWDDSGTVLTIQVKLKQGHAYRFGLNGQDHSGFANKKGIPLAPIRVSWRTR